VSDRERERERERVRERERQRERATATAEGERERERGPDIERARQNRVRESTIVPTALLIVCTVSERVRVRERVCARECPR
jgi:hypothetical protein